MTANFWPPRLHLLLLQATMSLLAIFLSSPSARMSSTSAALSSSLYFLLSYFLSTKHKVLTSLAALIGETVTINVVAICSLFSLLRGED
ncbi:hypothetical protein QVD17_38578 [Tagetes erecta]|uniref:Uncharacterized protein n=1 Tax=Tagetes erecta TaxID=13708 RepID=A0AAD8NGD0_TARER|nr:hypothetical protein QVD17_38578 [Tagetes erecta]